jgi:hypothetical protein
LLSLLKNRNNGGDGIFQDWVYQVLKIKDKPVNLYFFNDVMLPISEMGAFHAGLDTIRRDGGLRVFPSVWGHNDNADAGNIQLGEYVFDDDLRVYKNTLLELITYAALGSYRTLHLSGIYSFVNNELNNTNFYWSLALMDNRFLVDQGICNALVRTYDTAMQRRLYNWSVRPSLVVKKSVSTNNILLLQNWLLSQPQYRSLDSLMTQLPVSAFPLTARNNYKWFNFSNTSTRSDAGRLYKFRNEQTLGLVFNFLIRKWSLPKFLEIIKYDNYRYLAAPYENKLVIILENAMRVLMQPQTPDQLRIAAPADKKYLAPIALVHYFSGRSAEFSYSDFSRFCGPGFPEELFNLYTPNLKQAISGINVPQDVPDMWYELRDEIYRLITNN